MLKQLTLTLAILAATAAPAAAASGRPMVDEVVPIAEQHWQPWIDQWCPDGEVVTVVASSTLRAEGGIAWGAATIADRSCRILIDADLLARPRRLCVVLAHEMGHLLGHGHARAGLMRSRPWMRDPLCRAFPRALK